MAPRVAMARLLHHEGHLAAASRMVSSALAFERRDPHALETRAVLRMSEADHEGALHDLHAAPTCAHPNPHPNPNPNPKPNPNPNPNSTLTLALTLTLTLTQPQPLPLP